MEYSWAYPIYLIQHGGGYASIVDPIGSSESQILAVFTGEQAALEFMATFQLLGALRPLSNAREFRWLLASVKAPVTQVAFDPRPVALEVNAAWQVDLQQLHDTLNFDYSPWNYPVYVLAEANGFSAIQARSQDDEPLQLLALFTTRAKAEAYGAAAAETASSAETAAAEAAATALALNTVEEARMFLTGVSDVIQAVALDPIQHATGTVARHCFDVATLLDRYLVRDEEDRQEDKKTER